MLDPHTSLGIAQTIFFLPTLPLSIFLLYRNGKIRPRMAWLPLVSFTLMRIAGGPIIIALEKNISSVGLTVAALILLNVGVIPLLITDLGLIRIILMDNYGDHPLTHRVVVGLRLSFLAATALLASGGGITAGNTDEARRIGRTLAIAGYGVFAGILVVMTAMQAFFYSKKSGLRHSSQVILRTSLLASPFIAVRTAYGLLGSIFQNSPSQVWSPVYGSATVFAFMGLFMEYIALCIYFYGGFSISPRREMGAIDELASEEK